MCHTKNPKKLWLKGYGAIKHSKETQKRIADMVKHLIKNKLTKSENEIYEKLVCADRIESSAMWLVVHQTYAKKIHWDNRYMTKKDFKDDHFVTSELSFASTN